MSSRIMNIADVTLESHAYGDRFEASFGVIGARLGAKKLGYRLTVLKPGRRAWPFHNHHANEELFFILEGSGSVRIGTDTFSIRAGDLIACPTGGQETAHQIINSSDADLRYLCVSTMIEPEVSEYPDSGKLAVVAGAAPGGDKAARRLSFIGRASEQVDYWVDEG